MSLDFMALRGRRVLLLQGPVGMFFRRLGAHLRARGAHVVKLNFNGGDVFFYPGGIAYHGPMEGIPARIEALIEAERIDTVLLFGDCRPVHAGVHEIVRRRGIDLWVFEEGYIRPDYITCERHGVNGYSSIPRSPRVYRDMPPIDVPPAIPVGKAYWHMAAQAALYYVAASLARPWFRHYQHHRPLNLVEGLRWVRGAFRHYLYRLKERGLQTYLTSALAGRFYLVPLQVHNDAQVMVHSKYADVAEMIEEVLRSFARHAPSDTYLVFKHHPMDRAYRDYTALLRRLGCEHGVSGRLLYIHDQHLPTLLEHARGAVVINSTVGLAAIHQGVPTKTLGDAFYDFAGLTYQGSLDAFWSECADHAPDHSLYKKFRAFLIAHTQINGSFYRGCGWLRSPPILKSTQSAESQPCPRIQSI